MRVSGSGKIGILIGYIILDTILGSLLTLRLHGRLQSPKNLDDEKCFNIVSDEASACVNTFLELLFWVRKRTLR